MQAKRELDTSTSCKRDARTRGVRPFKMRAVDRHSMHLIYG